MTTTQTTATVTWVTSEPATSTVKYGNESSSGATRGEGDPTTRHSIEISMLDPGTTYTLRVHSVDECGYEVVSEQVTFRTKKGDDAHDIDVDDEDDEDDEEDDEIIDVQVSDVLQAPILVNVPSTMSGGSGKTVKLEWSEVSDPDGDPVQYLVEVSWSPDFSTPSHTSGWIEARSWSVTLPPGGSWFWRVRARDANHPQTMSDWSLVDSFYDVTMPGSCPFLFAWDGDEYRYLTDIQGPAIGLPASVLTIQNMRYYHAERVVLEGVAPDVEGRLRIKIRETQSEITYLDHTELIVVDCPEGHSVVSSTAQSTYSYGYAEPFEIVTVGRKTRAPVTATDGSGTPVLDALLEIDGRIVGHEKRYVLDFGPVGKAKHARLLIDGWSVYDRHKYPQKVLVQPFVEIRKKGKWVKLRSFGNPAGDMKRMAVDLSGAPPGWDGRIRINTGRIHAVRWFMDRVALDLSAPVTCSIERVGAQDAELYHAGRVPFSRANPHHPNIAWDEGVADNVHAYSYGSFTRYGGVLELLESPDDMYAILRHGDAVRVTFPAVKPPAQGMERHYILDSTLFYKHLSLSDSVEPLPYLGMHTYPYEGPGYPMDEEHVTYLETYNVRTYAR